MSNRLNKERKQELQPRRMEVAVAAVTNIGYKVTFQDETKIMFIHNDHEVTFYPYSGWASGKSIKDGRGLENLLKQLSKNNK
jgi:hypothetical protein